MQFKKDDNKLQSKIETCILLSKLSFLRAKEINELLEKFGSMDNILSTPLEKLLQISKINRRNLELIKEKVPGLSLEDDYKLIKKLGIKLVSFDDPSYPFGLRNIYDPPFLLYVRGNLKEEDERSVAVVGTRRPTNYGRMAAKRLARELARERITVVSGMARGIDTAAHEGALEEGGRTIAVLGCGVDVVYPPENRSLMQQIIERGAVISEFPLGTKPLAYNFPQRNRIISGLSKGVLVVEAPLKSGAMITVNYALDQGREVFAVPGMITNPYSRGTNRLIKEGAKVVEDISDILEELGFPSLKEDKVPVNLQLSFEEKTVLDKLRFDPVHIDEVAKETRFPVAKVADILMRLQIKGMVKELPGKLFIKEG